MSLSVCKPLRCSCQNLITQRIEIGSNAIIVEADHFKPKPTQLHGAQEVIFTADMLTAVNFDDQLGL